MWRSLPIGVVAALVVVSALVSAAGRSSTRQVFERQVLESAPLDPNVLALPPGYAGHDLEALYRGAAQPGKGEFESTAEYSARLATQRARPGVYAFMLRTAPVITYDADKELFTIRLIEDFGAIDGVTRNTSVRAITLVKDSSTTSSAATNAFGALVTVQHLTTNNDGIIFQGKPPGPGTERIHELTLPVARAEAAAVKPNLRVLFLCRLDPGTVSGASFSSASFDAPLEESATYHYLRGQLLAVWIYDLAAGTIFKRLETF